MSNETIHLEIDAGNETLTIYEESVKVERGGFVATFSLADMKGEKEIPIEQIEAIKQSDRKIFLDQKNHSQKPVVKDLNTVYMETRNDAEETAEQIRETIQERQNELSGTNDQRDSDTAMETLRQRFAEGEISEDEFQRKRESLEEASE